MKHQFVLLTTIAAALALIGAAQFSAAMSSAAKSSAAKRRQEIAGGASPRLPETTEHPAPKGRHQATELLPMAHVPPLLGWTDDIPPFPGGVSPRLVRSAIPWLSSATPWLTKSATSKRASETRGNRPSLARRVGMTIDREPHPTDAATESSGTVARPPKSQRLLGNASCVAANCHGGLRPENGIGGEYSTWVQNDPHARAYSVLHESASREMAVNLHLPKPAHESAECLSCHSPTTNAVFEVAKGGAVNAGVVTFRELPPFDGVGCEQCHGPAENWIESHVRTTWKDLAMPIKSQTGFRDLKDVLTRARTCVECHVGSSGKDVNHDLIAAGHPRLFFEMSAFHSNLPAHWHRTEDWKREYPEVNWRVETRPPDESRFAAKLWMLGQLATAEASVWLTQSRSAAAIEGRGPWPELAEWNCFACHHDLQSPSWRQSRNVAPRVLSKPTRNSWPFAMLDVIPKPDGDRSPEAAASALVQLSSRLAQPAAAPIEIFKSAKLAATLLTSWAEKLNQQDVFAVVAKTESLRKIMGELCGEFGELRLATSWDSAAQHVLALEALQTASLDSIRGAADDSKRRSRLVGAAILRSMHKTLDFPDDFNSPRDFSSEAIEQLQSDLRRMRAVLKDADLTTKP